MRTRPVLEKWASRFGQEEGGGRGGVLGSCRGGHSYWGGVCRQLHEGMVLGDAWLIRVENGGRLECLFLFVIFETSSNWAVKCK